MANISAKLSSLLDRLTSRSVLFTRTLAVIGGIFALQQVFKVVRFTSLYSLPRRTSLKRYINPSNDGGGDGGGTWALITGASDGIGKGFAEELCSRGVNAVLHGRNAQKLEGVRDELLKRWPTRQVRVLVLEASVVGVPEEGARQLDEAAASLQDLNLRILINNVGGSPEVLMAPLVERQSSDLAIFVDVNARFHAEITRVMMPLLMKNQPALVLTLGSGITELASPYVGVFAGTKAYSLAWSRCMALEMKAERQDIEFLYIQVGMVSSGYSPRATNMLVPSSRKFASKALDAAGCGRDLIWPYWPHALQFGLIGSLPRWLMDRIVVNMARKERAINEAKRKGQ